MYVLNLGKKIAAPIVPPAPISYFCLKSPLAGRVREISIFASTVVFSCAFDTLIIKIVEKINNAFAFFTVLFIVSEPFLARTKVYKKVQNLHGFLKPAQVLRLIGKRDRELVL
jgi:hypothetical protein